VGSEPAIRGDFQLRETHQFSGVPHFEMPLWAFDGVADGHVERAGLEVWRGMTYSTFVRQIMRGVLLFINAPDNPLPRRVCEVVSNFGLISE